MLARLQDWWEEFWFVMVKVERNTLGGQARHSYKRVPWVCFSMSPSHYYGGDRRGIGVYWSPRQTVWEGEYTYKHYVRFTWPRLFGLDWQ